MIKPRAVEFRDRILKLCKEQGQWVTLTEEHKPELKILKLEISIKIGDK